MKYYVLMQDGNSCNNPLVVKISVKDLPFLPSDIYEDKRIACNSIEAMSYYSGNITIEDYISSNIGFPIVTKRCKDVFQHFSIGNTKFIPIEIKDRPELKDELFVMHIRNHISNAINFDLCKYVGDRIAVFGLNESAVAGKDLFRLNENTNKIFISQKLLQAIKKKKLTGFYFANVRID